jgi:hypothetical protein
LLNNEGFFPIVTKDLYFQKTLVVGSGGQTPTVQTIKTSFKWWMGDSHEGSLHFCLGSVISTVDHPTFSWNDLFTQDIFPHIHPKAIIFIIWRQPFQFLKLPENPSIFSIAINHLDAQTFRQCLLQHQFRCSISNFESLLKQQNIEYTFQTNQPKDSFDHIHVGFCP